MKRKPRILFFLALFAAMSAGLADGQAMNANIPADPAASSNSGQGLPKAPAAASAPPKVDTGDTAWMLTSAALVLLMTPGLALFYGGMVRAKNVLGTIMHSFIIIAVISVQWVLFGYSLAFGPDWGGIIGSLSWIGLNGVGLDPNPDYGATVPHQVFMIYQAMFAIITPALITGAIAERMKFKTFLVFTVLWATLVYDPLAHWVWGAGGWMRNLGALDFAGGTVVHISSGISALAAATLGRKKAGIPNGAHGAPQSSHDDHRGGDPMVRLVRFQRRQRHRLREIGGQRLCRHPPGHCCRRSFLGPRGMALQRKAHNLGGRERRRCRPGRHHPGFRLCRAHVRSGHRVCGRGPLLRSGLWGRTSLGTMTVSMSSESTGLAGTWGALATGLFASKAINEAGADGLFFGNPASFGDSSFGSSFHLGLCLCGHLYSAENSGLDHGLAGKRGGGREWPRFEPAQ